MSLDHLTNITRSIIKVPRQPTSKVRRSYAIIINHIGLVVVVVVVVGVVVFIIRGAHSVVR